MIDLAAIRERCDAATAGPWGVENGDVVSVGNDGTRVVEGLLRHWTAMISQLGRTKSIETCREYAVRDIDFIAHSRQDIPALLEEVESFHRVLETQKAEGEAKDRRIEELKAEVRSCVPRSRYDACNQDWLDEQAKRREQATTFRTEYKKLEEQLRRRG